MPAQSDDGGFGVGIRGVNVAVADAGPLIHLAEKGKTLCLISETGEIFWARSGIL